MHSGMRVEERFIPGKTERREPAKRSEASIQASAAREQTAGGSGGAVSQPSRVQGQCPGKF